MTNDEWLIRLVGLLDKVASFFDVSFGAERQFQVAGAEVADIRDIAGETFFGYGGGIRVLDVNEEFSRLGVDLDASEVLEAAEGEVELEGLEFHVVTHFEDHGFEGVETVGEFLVGLGEVFCDRFVRAALGGDCISS